jgi:5'-nucleotidase
VAAQLAALKIPIDALSASPAGVAGVDLNGDRAAVRNSETNLGNLVVDAMAWYMRTKTTVLSPYPALPVVSHWNGGGIRASIPAGPVTRGQVVTVLPFGNRLVAKKVSAAALRAALNSGVSQWTGDSNAAGRFPQVGGLRFAFNSNATAAARVGRIVLKNATTEFDLDKYGGDVIVFMNDYVAGGGDG